MSKIEQVAKLLREIANGKYPDELSLGLCYIISQILDVGNMRRIMERAKDWEHYSGDPTYPVPYGDFGPDEAYIWGKYEQSLYSGEYGEMRRDLAGFLADTIWPKWRWDCTSHSTYKTICLKCGPFSLYHRVYFNELSNVYDAIEYMTRVMKREIDGHWIRQ